MSPGVVVRGGQPGPNDIRRLAARGVKTIVNLRGVKPSGFLFLEEEACAAAGLTLEHFRVFSREAPSPEILHGARSLFERIQYPAYFHCKSGADRVGLMSTLYLFFQEGEPLPKALRHLSLRYGHVKLGKTGVIDAAFDEYITYADQNGRALDDIDGFFEWVDGPYDHLATKARFRSAFAGDLLTEHLLRRE